MVVRAYTVADYESVAALYNNTKNFGGQYADERDSFERLKALSEKKHEAILVAEHEGEIVGTVTLFEDGRAAWLYRFAVAEAFEEEATEMLYKKVISVLKELGHEEVLVYAPAGDEKFQKRYEAIGFTKGNDYTTYWQKV